MSNAATYYQIIKRPLITEKALALATESKYTFEVDLNANKIELSKAFETLFPGRKVLGIQTIKMYPQQKRVGRKMGHTSVGKKAIFTVQGEPLEFFTGA